MERKFEKFKKVGESSRKFLVSGSSLLCSLSSGTEAVASACDLGACATRRPTFVHDFLGRLQPSKTTSQKTLGTLGVEEPSYPCNVIHFYTGNSYRGRMRAEL